MNKGLEALTHEKVTALKGVAILWIMLHNFYHFIFSKTKENEVDFDPARFEYFLTDFIVTPSEWIAALFTYFGHFGVQIFIFLSAYTLCLSYPSGGFQFFISRIKKLYPTIIATMALWLTVYISLFVALTDITISQGWQYLQPILIDLVALLTGVYNFVPGSVFPMVGPWWFIPFILQFYMMWSVSASWLNKTSLHRLSLCFIASLAISLFCIPLVKSHFDINLLLTVFGHLPEIIFAVYCARFGIPKLGYMLMVGAPLLFISSLYAEFYFLHHLSALLVFLPLSILLIRFNNNAHYKVMLWLGRYSLTLFLVNGILRNPFAAFAQTQDSMLMSHVIAGVFLGMSCLVAYAVDKSVNRLLRNSNQCVTRAS